MPIILLLFLLLHSSSLILLLMVMMAKLSAERKQKQKRKLERLLPITMGRQINADNAVVFFFNDPTADDDG